MNYKKSTVALCVGTAILAGSAFAQATTSDVKASFASSAYKETHYAVQLNSNPALFDSVSSRTDYSEELSIVTTQQDDLFRQILAIDPTAEIISSRRLLSNSITLRLDPKVLDEVKSLANVRSILASEVNSRVMSTQNKASLQNNVTADDGEAVVEVEYLSPYSGSDTAGEGVSVAIVSTGIDYTLSMFGGSGVYGDDDDPETPPVAGSYLDALEHGAVGPTIPAVEDDPATPDVDESADAIPGYDLFPTSVVVGGRDFVAENYGVDGNPIDQNHEYEHFNGAIFPTGMGTQLASIVHQLAPGAELHAYKVYDVSESYGEIRARWPSRDNVNAAIEHALDPNQDGDTSDHLDIMLLDAGGAAAFYNQYEQSGSGAILIQDMIQKASALGMTIVTHAGYGGGQTGLGEETDTIFRNWVSWEGSAPAAITVGSAEMMEDGTVVPAKWSPKGPIRGSLDLKPEVMSYAVDMPVSLISNADETAPKIGTRSEADVGSARIAAAVAVIKSKNPELGPVELKALLANTADHNIKEMDYATGEVIGQAELIHIGHGIENVENAISSPVAVWNAENNQPYVQFGFHEVGQQKTIVKKVTVRNFSETAQTYNVNYMAHGDKAAQAAVMINHPSTVSVPANRSVTIAVEMTIDGNLLPEWPLTSSEEYVEENYKATELNGYLQLTSDGNPDLNVGWMVQARPETQISKSGFASEYPYSLGWNSELGRSEWVGLDWARDLYPHGDNDIPQYFSIVSSFVNESSTPTTFAAYPIVESFDNPPKDKANTFGHKIKAVGALVLDDAQCSVTGKKISVAVNLWEPAHDAMANWSDKIGTPLFFYEMFSEDVIEETGADESFAGINQYSVMGGESVLIGQPFVDIDENGRPATFYIDYNMEYVYQGPSRIKKSKLPVKIAPNGKNVVSEICLEELAHDEISDAPDDDSIPLMIPVLDENGLEIAERAQCNGFELDWLIDNGYFEAYGAAYCSTSTGQWDAEGYALDADGNRIVEMEANLERGVPGQNELINWFDQNLGFHFETDRDATTVKYEPIVQFNPTKGGYFVPDVEICEQTWIGFQCEISNIDETANVGLALVAEGEDVSSADFGNMVTAQPGEEVTIAAVRYSQPGSLTDEIMVISTDDNFSQLSPISYVDLDGSATASVREEQQFSVMENVEAGTVVGEIKLDTAGFFSISGSSEYSEFTLSIMNALPGSPFAINQETYELYVVNPDALDYENNQEFEVLVQAMHGRTSSKSAAVKVYVTDANDVAPVVNEAEVAKQSQQSVVIDGTEGSFSIDVAGMFTDSEGQGLTYSVMADGISDISVDGTVVSGNITEPGDYVVTVTASDGVNETSADFSISAEKESSSSSGSFGGMLLGLAGLLMFRRRK